MTIELGRLLTISARDYCEMYGKELNQYNARGIHLECSNEGSSKYHEIAKQFSEIVPENAEIVVGYKAYAGGRGPGFGPLLIMGADGTALIPKEK